MTLKYKRINLVGGSTSFPVGDTDALRRTRSESVLKACADALISMNIGWVCDVSRNPTTSDFSDVPCMSGGITYPGLFFINSRSGCKLFMCYFGGRATSSGCIKDFSGSDLLNVASPNYIGGLCISIIPEDSLNTFGSSFDSSFLPADATRICGTMRSDGTNSNYFALGCNPTSGYTYSWGIFANEYLITLEVVRSTNSTPAPMYMPSFASGKLIKVLAHDEDNLPNAKYMTLVFRPSVSNYFESDFQGNNPISTDEYIYAGGEKKMLLGVRVTSFTTGFNYGMGSICKSDGTWLNNTSASFCVILIPLGVEQLSSYVFDPTGGKTRWIPYSVLVLSSDLSTYGIISGDGYKGIIDPDFIRAINTNNQSNITYADLLDDGKFMCVHGSRNFIIGWDPSNTDSPAH